MGAQHRYVRDAIEGWYEPKATKNLDWQNSADYEFVKKLDCRGLAWEFLRKNQEYARCVDGWIEFRRESARSIAELARDKTISASEYSDRYKQWKLEVDRKCDAICEQFGLSKEEGLRHPSNPSGPVFEDQMTSGAEVLSVWIDGEELPWDQEGFAQSNLSMDVRISIDRPIKTQLEEIKAHYEWLVENFWHIQAAESQDEVIAQYGDGDSALTVVSRPAKKTQEVLTALNQRKRPPKKDLFQEYLRILDARAEGIIFDEIAEVLYPGDKADSHALNERVRTRLKAAVKLVQGGYREIVARRIQI